MILLIILLAILFILFTLYFYDDGILASIFSGIGVTFVVGFPVLVILVLISNAIINENASDYVWKTVKSEIINIKTLNIKSEISGSFFLGSGNLNSDAKYYYYVSVNDSTSYLSSTNCIGTRIVESNNVSPCVVTYEKFVDWSKSELRWYLFPCSGLNKYKIIYVPKHTIIVNYNLKIQ